MKTLRTIAVIGLMIGAVSCKKSGSSPSNSTTDDAADLVTASISTNTQGSTTNDNDIAVSAVAAVAVDSTCGKHWTDSVSRSISDVAGYSYTYKGVHNYTLNCGTGSNGFFDGSVDVASVFNGTINNPYLSSTFSGTGAWVFAGVGHGSSILTINGEYKRSGVFKSKIDTTFTGSHSIDLVVTNLVLNKPLNTVKSGTATFTITGNTLKKGQFSYTGTIVYNGGVNATLTINGSVYFVNLVTGVKRRA